MSQSPRSFRLPRRRPAIVYSTRLVLWGHQRRDDTLKTVQLDPCFRRSASLVPDAAHNTRRPSLSQPRSDLEWQHWQLCGCGRAGDTAVRVVNKVIAEFKAVEPGACSPGFAGAVMAASWVNCRPQGKSWGCGGWGQERPAQTRYALTAGYGWGRW